MPSVSLTVATMPPPVLILQIDIREPGEAIHYRPREGICHLTSIPPAASGVLRLAMSSLAQSLLLAPA